MRNSTVQTMLPVMPWWEWVLLAWAIAATVGGFLLGAVAAKARERERAMRARWYAETLPDYVPEERAS